MPNRFASSGPNQAGEMTYYIQRASFNPSPDSPLPAHWSIRPTSSVLDDRKVIVDVYYPIIGDYNWPNVQVRFTRAEALEIAKAIHDSAVELPE